MDVLILLFAVIIFGIALVVGVVLGSLVYSLMTKKFRWEGFASIDDLRTQLIGAVLMGFGGVTAMGSSDLDCQGDARTVATLSRFQD